MDKVFCSYCITFTHAIYVCQKNKTASKYQDIKDEK